MQAPPQIPAVVHAAAVDHHNAPAAGEAMAAGSTPAPAAAPTSAAGPTQYYNYGSPSGAGGLDGDGKGTCTHTLTPYVIANANTHITNKC